MNKPIQTQTLSILVNPYQAGFTLIEILVAMTLTLLISAGAATLFANTVLNTKTLNSATEINEESLRINALLSRHIRMSGYIDWLSNATVINTITGNESSNSSSFNLKQADQAPMFQRAFVKTQTKADYDTIPLPLSGCNGNYISNDFLNNNCSSTSTDTSAITVAYQVNSEPKTGFSAILPNILNTNNKGVDCLGNEINTLYAVNRFYLKAIASSDSGQKSNEPIIYDLMCAGNGGGRSQPLASNIQQWVITYGIPTNSINNTNTSVTNDTQITEYLSADNITAKKAWNQVVSVRSCFVLVGERGSATAVKNQTNTTQSTRLDCNNQPMVIGLDKRLRQAFTQTIALRNQIHTPNLIN